VQNHKFFQDDIYKLNREIKRFTGHENKNVVLSAYNPINLCLNYFSVYRGDDVDRWRFRDKDHERAVRRFLDVEKKDDFNKFLDKHAYTRLLKEYRDKDLHYFLLNLYNNFPVNPALFFDGIIKKILSEFIQNDKLIKYAFIDALDPEGEKFNFTYFQWFDMRLFYHDRLDDHPEMGVIADQESGKYYKYGEWFGRQYPECQDVKNSSDVRRPPLDLHLEKYFFQYLLPFFNAFRDENGTIFNGDRLFPLKVKQLSAIRHFLIIPFYDAWIDERPCGMIQGNLSILPFQDEVGHEKRTVFIKENLNKYSDWTRSVSKLLHESRSHELLMLPSQPEDDSLRDFLRKVACIQEWKRIMVFNRSENNPELEYCFKRYLGGKTGGLLEYEDEWNICKESEGCTECIPDGLKDYLRTKISTDNAIYERQKDNTYIFCIMLKDILHSRILPSIEDADIARYKNHILCFEFPEYTFFPRAGGGKKERAKILGEHYIDKLIPIFDRLLLNRKVLKHSIKSAVSAIISRNHSHHIGSHVTPRSTVTKIQKRLKELGYPFDVNYKIESDNLKALELKKKEIEIIDHLKSQLDEYIQKKADFIAEISTEPLTSTKSMPFFNEVIMYFIRNSLIMDNIGANEGVKYKEGKYDENRLRIHAYVGGRELVARFNGGQSCSCDQFSHLRLPYSGFCNCSEPGPLQVIHPELDDVAIALPGPLGEFAFYSFLENFIRNSVKHNHNILRKDADSYLDIHINISELEEDDRDRDEFYKVEIWDNITKPSKELKERLVQFIDEPIVDNYGQLRKGGWGIAEMKIMATLLRGSDDFTTMSSNLKVSGKEKLVYEFRIMKPKRVAVISNNCEKNETHRKKGVWWFSSLKEFLDYQVQGTSPASFDLVILDRDVTETYEEYGHLLPFRILVHNKCKMKMPGTVEIDDAFMESIRKSDAASIMSAAWQRWVGGLLERSGHAPGARLGIFFSQDDMMPPTSEWLSKAYKWEREDCKPKLSIIFQGEDDNEIRPPVSQEERLFIFDRHFDGYESVPEDTRIAFHEAFDKNSSDFVPIFCSMPTDEMICRLAESACLKVLIMDERIAEVAYEDLMRGEGNKPDKLYGSKKRLVVSRWANIFIATHLRINDTGTKPLHHDIKDRTPQVLVELSTGTPGEKRINDFSVYWCDAKNERQKIILDALIVHQGVLENFFGEAMPKKKGEAFIETLKAFVDDLKKFIPYIVVESGRGIPSNLPPKIKFIPFSLLENYVMKDRISKYSLTRVIMSLISIRRGN